MDRENGVRIFGSLNRLSNFPLDSSSVCLTEEAFLRYITTDDSHRSTAYPGQIIYIVESSRLVYVRETKTDYNRYEDCYYEIISTRGLDPIRDMIANIVSTSIDGITVNQEPVSIIDNKVNIDLTEYITRDELEAAEARLIARITSEKATLTERIDNNLSDINALKNRATVSEGKIDELTAASTQASANIQANTTEISGVKTRLTQDETRIITAETDIDALENRVTSVENDVDALETSVANNTAAISQANASITSINTNLSLVDEKITSLREKDTNLQTQINTLTDTVALNRTDANQRIAAVENKANTNTSNISTLQSDMVGVRANIANLENNKADKFSIASGSNISVTYDSNRHEYIVASTLELKAEVVTILPGKNNAKPNTIYLLPKAQNGEDRNLYDEYIYIDNGNDISWEKIGDTRINLQPIENEIAALTATVNQKADAATVNTAITGINAEIDQLQTDVSNIADTLDTKASTSYVDEKVSDINQSLATKAATTYVDEKVTELTQSIATKASTAYVDGKVSEINTTLATKADASYVEGEVEDINEDIETINSEIETIQEALAGKQDTINDIAEIRANANLATTALQNIKTVNGESLVGQGNVEITTYHNFEENWPTTGTVAAFAAIVKNDPKAIPGNIYLGDVTFDDLPFSGNGELTVAITGSAAGKVVFITLTSGNVAPYHWEYTYWGNGFTSGWKSFLTNDSDPSEIPTNATHRFVTDTQIQTWNNKYTRPAAGIPASDLDSATQAILTKADTNVYTKAETDAQIEANGGKINTIKVNNTALQIDSNKAVNIDLTSYATNSSLNSLETSLNSQIDTLSDRLDAVISFSIEIVNTLPQENIKEHTIYLVGSAEQDTNDYYTEYLYINNAWERIGALNLDISGKADTSYVDQAVSNVNSSISDINSDISNIEGDISDINSTVDDITVGMGSLNSAVTDLTNNLEAANQSISSLSQDVSNINTNISSIEDDIAGVSSDLSEAQSELEEAILALDTRILDSNARISNLETAMPTKASTTYVNDAISTVNDSISDIEDDISDINTALETKASTAYVDNAVSTINSTIADIESDISDINDTLETKADTSYVDTTATNLGNSISANTDRIATLETGVSENTSSINSLEDSVEAIDDRVDALETTTASHTSSISSLTSAVESNAAAIDTLETNVESDGVRISALESSVSANTTSIGNLQTSVSTLDSTKEDKITFVAGPNMTIVKSASGNSYTFSSDLGITLLVVEELPELAEASSSVIYLKPNGRNRNGNIYDEYIVVRGNPDKWEIIGNTAIDLEPYATSEALSQLAATVPVRTSELINDSNFITKDEAVYIMDYANPNYQYALDAFSAGKIVLLKGAPPDTSGYAILNYVSNSYATFSKFLTSRHGTHAAFSTYYLTPQNSWNTTDQAQNLIFKRVLANETPQGNEDILQTLKVGDTIYKLVSKTSELLNDSDFITSAYHDSTKTDKEITSNGHKSLIFNESDGGGAKFEHSDGTNSFVGVNDGGENGIAAQLYVVNKNDSTDGVKINLEKGKITYIKNKATSERTDDDEIAVVGQINTVTDLVNTKQDIIDNEHKLNIDYVTAEYTTDDDIKSLFPIKVANEEEFVNALNSGEKYFKLDGDLSTSTSFNIDGFASINLNGHTIASTTDSALRVFDGGKLIIEGNGNINAQEFGVLAVSGSTVTINGGVFTTTDNVVVGTNGTEGKGANTIIINSGTFNGNITTPGYIACGIYAANNDTIILNGGTFNITNGVGVLARSGKVVVGPDVVFNVTGNGTRGKVGDSKVTVPSGEVLVLDLKANYPGGTPELENNNENYEIYTIA